MAAVVRSPTGPSRRLRTSQVRSPNLAQNHPFEGFQATCKTVKQSEKGYMHSVRSHRLQQAACTQHEKEARRTQTIGEHKQQNCKYGPIHISTPSWSSLNSLGEIETISHTDHTIPGLSQPYTSRPLPALHRLGPLAATQPLV